jgi:hypothetical protein
MLTVAGGRLVHAFPWHLRVFLAANATLNIVNAFTGGHWWAFWPLLATGVLLGVHYLFYKAVAVDERWVDARIEELNLKSYDRSHIEDLKVRHGGKRHSPTATGE